MSWSANDRKTAALASMFGYRVSRLEEGTYSPSDFSLGDGVIVLTRKGEPVMSGNIAEFGYDKSSLRIGEKWYTDQYMFRKM